MDMLLILLLAASGVYVRTHIIVH